MSDAFDQMLRERGERIPERPRADEKDAVEPEKPSLAIPAEAGAAKEKRDEPEISPESVSPAGPSVSLPSMDILRDQILGALRRVRHSLAAAMEKAELWEIDGDILTLTFRTTFEISFLEKERHEIEKTIQESLNYSLHLKTQLKRHEDESVKQEVEEQVELVRSVFRGTIMKRSKS